jgi:hypothetical protein
MSEYQSRIAEYYLQKHIHPEHFQCIYRNVCRNHANHGKMTEAKMSMVGSRYGENYPKIVVVSLDPPSGKIDDASDPRWHFTEPYQRTTQYVSALHEKDNYTVDRPNPHWAMTQIIVKDIIEMYGFRAQRNAAVVLESYSGRPIENVSAYFCHVNVAKCSMNNEGQRQANEEVHNRCSHYLNDELTILKPDILISQGASTNKLLGTRLIKREIKVSDLPFIKVINFNGLPVLWMPMHHPTQQINKIRALWPEYKQTVQKHITAINSSNRH